jgi:hypothetical protein
MPCIFRIYFRKFLAICLRSLYDILRSLFNIRIKLQIQSSYHHAQKKHIAYCIDHYFPSMKNKEKRERPSLPFPSSLVTQYYDSQRNVNVVQTT